MAVGWLRLISGMTNAVETAKGLASLLPLEPSGSADGVDPIAAVEARLDAMEAHEEEQDTLLEEVAVQLRDLALFTQGLRWRLTVAYAVSGVSIVLGGIALVRAA